MDTNEQSPAANGSESPMTSSAEPVLPGLATADEVNLVLPTLSPETGDPAAAKRAMHAVVGFHRADPGAGEDLPRPAGDFIPALLHPFRNPSRIRHDYPLFLHPPGAARDDRLCQPVAEVLKSAVAGIAPGDDEARILKDNLSRIERRVRESMAGDDRAVYAVECISGVAEALVSELDLNADNQQQLRDDLARLLAALPGGGRLIGLTEKTPIQLFLLAAGHRAVARYAELRHLIVQLRRRLHDMLLVDLEKEPEGRDPSVLGGTVGTIGDDMLDPSVLAQILGPARGAHAMPPERRQRIQELLELLDGYLDRDDPPVMRVIHDGNVTESGLEDGVDWRQAKGASPSAAAVSLFDAQAEAYAKLYAAMRMARLELADAYDPTRHDHLLSGFDWEAFTHDELLAMPAIVVLETADHMVGDDLLGMSRLQLSGRPISEVVIVQPGLNPSIRPGQDPLLGYRFELAYLGVSYREALVHQTSAARPVHLMDGIQASLAATRASLHVVASGLAADGQQPALGAWLHAGAALEGRAHPFFHFDPDLGATWARRFDISDNPQSELDWPVYQLACRAEDGDDTHRDLAFTFAEFALLEPGYREHFRVIPPACDDERLITIADYLAMTPAEAMEFVPYVWAVDGDGVLHRLVISRRLAFACRDRLGFWRTMQELAGVRNEHVTEAVEREREKLKQEFAAEREELEQAHAAEIEKVRTEAAAEVLHRLAAGLVQTDLSGLTAAPSSAPRPATAPAAPAQAQAEQAAAEPAEEAPQAAVEEEDDDAGPAEPWIDSILCTTCNDCINLNPQLFVYNGNKQAMIGDPKAGTFAQLVEAAVKCPARCIHPGKPLNPDEPNLDELIERARPFN